MKSSTQSRKGKPEGAKAPGYAHGPWRLCKKEEKIPRSRFIIEAPCDFPPGFFVEIAYASYKPNARLIALAPELLQCLRDYVGSYAHTSRERCGNPEKCVRCRALKLIDRAEGKTS